MHTAIDKIYTDLEQRCIARRSFCRIGEELDSMLHMLSFLSGYISGAGVDTFLK